MNLFDSWTTAVVSIDLQEANLGHAEAPYSSEEVIERSVRVMDAARAAGSLVVHVRTSFLPDDSDSLWTRRTDAGHGSKPERVEGWDRLVSEVAPLPEEPVVVKRSWNAFHGSDLDLQLRRHGITTIVLVGMTTNFGVEGTGRAAFDHFYDVVFAEDAMSGSSTEAHQAAVTGLFPRIGRVRSAEEVVAAFSAGSESDAQQQETADIG